MIPVLVITQYSLWAHKFSYSDVNFYVGLVVKTDPPSVWPHLFCGAGHEKRRGEQLKWSLAFRLYIGSFVFHVHSYQDQFIQPGWAECFF